MKRLATVSTCVLLAACGSTSLDPPQPFALDRPIDVAFACHGGLRVLGSNGTADYDDDVVTTAQPLQSCAIRSWSRTRGPGEGKARPVGQEDDPIAGDDIDPDPAKAIPVVDYHGFVLQSVPGTIAILRWSTIGFEQDGDPADISDTDDWTGQDIAYQDADELTPGNNSVAVGELPIAIGTDRAGCHLITANAGSCDLSVVDVPSIVDFDPETPPNIIALTVVDAAGQPVLARPASMIAEPAEDTQPIGVECPAEPEGLVYVAYPECHTVAAVRASTGAVEAHIDFAADGTATVVNDGNLACPAQCGAGGVPTAGGRPVTVDIVHDTVTGTRRMVIGADDSPRLTIVELDAGYLPTTATQLALEGDLGVLDVAMTPTIGMGGVGGFEDQGLNAGQHQFVYAVADDATVRVAEITGVTLRECDTQVDPRYLRLVTDPNQLVCLPVGDITTPPRRAYARSPGIELERESVPTAVAIVQSAWDEEDETPFLEASDPAQPDTLIGYFALVSTASGGTAIVSIDDDVYPDFWDPTAPMSTQLPLALPHQLRDSLTDREAVQGRVPDPEGENPDSCSMMHAGELQCFDTVSAAPFVPISIEQGGISVSTGSFMNPIKSYALPQPRRVRCEGVDVSCTLGSYVVPELGFPQPSEQRDLAFPDLRAVSTEQWSFIWEGLLSLDNIIQDTDGPTVRSGVVTRDGDQLRLSDSSRPFCSIGAQPYDIAVLVGCDPENGDNDCAIGETCFVHPDSTQSTGACLPEDEADGLASRCRDFLISSRRYSITSTEAGELVAMPRRRVLETTPLDGCTSDTHCDSLYEYRRYLATDKHPTEPLDEDDPVLPDRTFSCEPDPSRSAAVNMCVMTCEDSSQCDSGSVCDDGYCVDGPVPPQSCVPGLQRYQVRAGEAITVVGALSGYLHSIIEDPSGVCVPDPAANPLLIGRIPLTAPPCPGPDDYTALTPNPCSTTVEHTEVVPDYESGSCELASSSGVVITRDAPAIRFKNPAFTFHMVDPWYPGDAECREDRAGALGMVPTVHRGYLSGFDVESGYNSNRIGSAVIAINVVRGPENSIWIIDQGERVPQQSGDESTRGQIMRHESWDLTKFSIIK